MIGLQPLKTLRHRIHDVAAACADVVGTRTHAAIGFRGDNHIGALDADILQSLTEQPLRQAVGIDVGRVDQIDAGFQGAHDNVRDRFLIELAERLVKRVVAAEGHRAETDLGNEQARLAQLIVFHGCLLSGLITMISQPKMPTGCVAGVGQSSTENGSADFGAATINSKWPLCRGRTPCSRGVALLPA